MRPADSGAVLGIEPAGVVDEPMVGDAKRQGGQVRLRMSAESYVRRGAQYKADLKKIG